MSLTGYWEVLIRRIMTMLEEQEHLSAMGVTTPREQLEDELINSSDQLVVEAVREAERRLSLRGSMLATPRGGLLSGSTNGPKSAAASLAMGHGMMNKPRVPPPRRRRSAPGLLGQAIGSADMPGLKSVLARTQSLVATSFHARRRDPYHLSRSNQSIGKDGSHGLHGPMAESEPSDSLLGDAHCAVEEDVNFQQIGRDPLVEEHVSAHDFADCVSPSQSANREGEDQSAINGDLSEFEKADTTLEMLPATRYQPSSAPAQKPVGTLESDSCRNQLVSQVSAARAHEISPKTPIEPLRSDSDEQGSSQSLESSSTWTAISTDDVFQDSVRQPKALSEQHSDSPDSYCESNMASPEGPAVSNVASPNKERSETLENKPMLRFRRKVSLTVWVPRPPRIATIVRPRAYSKTYLKSKNAQEANEQPETLPMTVVPTALADVNEKNSSGQNQASKPTEINAVDEKHTSDVGSSSGLTECAPPTSTHGVNEVSHASVVSKGIEATSPPMASPYRLSELITLQTEDKQNTSHDSSSVFHDTGSSRSKTLSFSGTPRPLSELYLAKPQEVEETCADSGSASVIDTEETRITDLEAASDGPATGKEQSSAGATPFNWSENPFASPQYELGDANYTELPPYTTAVNSSSEASLRDSRSDASSGPTVCSSQCVSENEWLLARQEFDDIGSCVDKRVESHYDDRDVPNSSRSHDSGESLDLMSDLGSSPVTGKQPRLSSMRDGLKWLWKTSAFADLTVSCGHYAFPLHSCILSAQCAFFSDACRKRPSSTTERYILAMDEEDPVALRSMLKYFYTGNLSVPMDNLLILGGPAMPSIDILLKVYRLACKYDLPELKVLATEQYCAALSEKWPKGHGLLLAKGLAEAFSQDLSDAEVLQEAVLDVAVKCSEELLGDKVVFDMLYGEPLRALFLKLSRDNGVGRNLAPGESTCEGDASIASRKGSDTYASLCRRESTRSISSELEQWR